ncbi:MAG: SNF2-related protein [Bryobacterales bacterium]|nr:SNF2-related protein [Bryobacterales bacterium]
MSISSHLAHYFSEGVRQRGLQYVREGRVRLNHGSATEFDGRVRGTETYEVMIAVSGNELRLHCACPYFATDGKCKHLWAAILAAEKLRYLGDAAAVTRVAGQPDSQLSADDEVVERALGLRPIPSRFVAPWRNRVNELIGTVTDPVSSGGNRWPAGRQILYVLDRSATGTNGSLSLSIYSRDRRSDGEWGRMTPINLRRADIGKLPDSTDHGILAAISGALMAYNYSWGGQNQVPTQSMVDAPLARVIIPDAARAGRLFLRDSPKSPDINPVSWNEEPWTFALELERSGDAWTLKGALHRGEETLGLRDAEFVTQDGFVFANAVRTAAPPDEAHTPEHEESNETERRRLPTLVRDLEVSPLESGVGANWISQFTGADPIEIPDEERDEFLASLLSAPRLPRIRIPEELEFEEVSPKPLPLLRISSVRDDPRNMRGVLAFDYQGHAILQQAVGAGVYDSAARRFIRRDQAAETAASDRIASLGARYQAWHNDVHWLLPAAKLQRTIRVLASEGWHVETDGQSFRSPGEIRVEVTSGIDWFDLSGEVSYGNTSVRLPELLEALRRGDSVVRLPDGGFGLLPEEWLKKFGLIAGLGTAVEGNMRFQRAQAGLLDALLLAQPQARYDEAFGRIRNELRTFGGIETAQQPEGFIGTLRDYQREGLGWMHFLRRFGFGGCLADDMGVGKTPQVLALLEERRALRQANPGDPLAPGPTLVVVPKSLVFNWKLESERFTPRLRFFDYTGAGRTAANLAEFDVIITTYGTLRRDAPRLKDIHFDYIVLDEAQAVKNASSESAKAVRLLKGRNRLVLSGTPVENHLGELWSLFEFLNPGMLGAASVFKMTSSSIRNPDDETRDVLAHALRPFILRRTKSQVARELPERTEQTLHCILEPTERRLYNELRQHFRETLLGRIQKEGIGKSGIHVLEALLRLRQAACHPGLLDPKKVDEPSAKLDMLLDHITQILEEGHKALIFSQFTSLLDIVRKRLDKQNVVYEYLDGKTRNRQERVERFQNDPNCPLFLISLKAGGVGLNLTAAGYVFLLDPWWNPAVEAQAIDRTHRIGQTRQVFAYRLIATDTVEEKVLELQKSKRDLASAIISADNSLIRNLQREDIEMLLS